MKKGCATRIPFSFRALGFSIFHFPLAIFHSPLNRNRPRRRMKNDLWEMENGKAAKSPDLCPFDPFV
jgi:hypothetical protein